MPKPHFDAWRIFRILAEFVEGFETMTDIGPSVSIFGSARSDPSDPYYKLGVEVAHKISKKGFAIITGGGRGIMEAANKGAKEAKGRSCGISIALPYELESNPYVDPRWQLHLRYFFVRKVMFVRYAQAFVALPGGYGTLDEVFESLTLIQTKKIRPFPIFLMGSSYWEGLIDWLKSVVLKYDNLHAEDFDLFRITDDPDEVADSIEKHYKKTGVAPTFDLGSIDQEYHGKSL